MLKDLLYILSRLIYLVPPIQMFVLFILSLIECFTDYKFSNDRLFDLGLGFGSSITTSLVYIVMFFNPKANYCLFTKCMVIGLILNQYLYMICYYIPNELYQKFYTIFSFAITLVGYYILIFKNKKNETNN